MMTVREGDKEDIRMGVEQVSGTGTWSLTTPLRRILDSSRALVAGFDWAACTWDSTNEELYWLFDSTAGGLTPAGTYYVQFRGSIGTEVLSDEVMVLVVEVGP